jgi:catechol 2,3-dioxygenase-like lactoylglutathione lyase family enzyme
VTTSEQFASVRYIVDDVDAAIDFYTGHLGFTLHTSAAPAFADVTRGPLRLLLSGPTSSGARALTDGTQPEPGGWNRIHLIVDHLDTEIDRLQTAGLSFRNDVVAGPGGRQILLTDPAGNLIELFEPAHQPATRQGGAG